MKTLYRRTILLLILIFGAVALFPATNPAAQGNGSGTMAADMFRVSGGKRVTDVPAFTSVPKITFKCQMSAANAAASFTRNATQTFLAAA